MRYRGDSKIMDAPEVRISDELEARIMKRFERTVRLALRYPAGVPAKVLTALKGSGHLARARVFHPPRQEVRPRLPLAGRARGQGRRRLRGAKKPRAATRRRSSRWAS